MLKCTLILFGHVAQLIEDPLLVYCIFVGGNLVTWQSKKQSVVASSAEAEFRALGHGICEGIWIRRLLEELRFSQTIPMHIFVITRQQFPLPTIQSFTIGRNLLKLINTS